MFTKNRIILILGILVALMPFFGFPSIYENGFYVIAGLAIAVLSFLVARHKRVRLSRKTSKGRVTDVYAETAPIASAISNPEPIDINEVSVENPAQNTDSNQVNTTSSDTNT